VEKERGGDLESSNSTFDTRKKGKKRRLPKWEKRNGNVKGDLRFPQNPQTKKKKEPHNGALGKRHQ